MRLGVNVTPYMQGGFTLEQAFEHVHNLGIHYVDLPGFFKFMPQYWPEREHFRLAKVLERLNMEAYSTIYLPRHNMGSNNPEERLAAVEETKHSCRFIRNMGGKALLLCEAAGRPDYYEDLTKEEAMLNSVESMQRLCEWADKELNGLLVLLEIVPIGGVFCSMESMKDFCDRVGAPNLYINADIGHMNLQKVNGKRMRVCGDKLISVHISDDDNRGIQGQVAEAECVIGEGTTDFKGYFDELIALDVDSKARKAGLEECYCMIEGAAKNIIYDPDWSTMRARDYILENLPYFGHSVFKF